MAKEAAVIGTGQSLPLQEGGNRQQGMNDFTFGGNFNRLKNLMVRNGGLYLTPDFTDFGDKGEVEIAALIAEFKKRAPQAKFFVACGSMGGMLCWRLAQDTAAGKDISGLILLGSLWDDQFIGSPSYKRHRRSASPVARSRTMRNRTPRRVR